VKIEDRTVVFAPASDSGFQAMFTLVVDTNCTVFEASADEIALNLIGCDRGDSRTGERTNFLEYSVNGDQKR